MCAISAGINERKKIFILVIVGVIDTNFDVSEKDRTVGKFPDFLFSLLVGVIRRFLQVVEEATIEDLIGEDNVGHKHYLILYYIFTFYLGFRIRNILFIIYDFFLIWFDIQLTLFCWNIIVFLFLFRFFIITFYILFILPFLFDLFGWLLLENFFKNLWKFFSKCHMFIVILFYLLKEFLTKTMGFIRLYDRFNWRFCATFVILFIHISNRSIHFYPHNPDRKSTRLNSSHI